MAMVDESTVLNHVISLFEDLTQDLDIDPISGTTRFNSLGIESIDFMLAITELQAHFDLGDRVMRQLEVMEVGDQGLEVQELVAVVVQAAEAKRRGG